MKKTITFHSVGTKIWDDLTGKSATIIGITFTEGKTPSGNCIGAVGYWLDNDYLGGGRQSWEISQLKDNLD